MGAIYGHLWTSRHPTPESLQIAQRTWAKALADVPLAGIKKTLEYLAVQGGEYPPVLPKFIKLCLENSGLPTEDQCYELAMRRDFTHPIVKLCFEKVTSWAFTHDSEKDLKKKFNAAYQEVLRRHDNTALLMLE